MGKKRYRTIDNMQRQYEVMSDYYSGMQKLLTHPLNIMGKTPAGRVTNAWLATSIRLTKKYGKPEFDIEDTEVDGELYPVSESTVMRKPFCNLLRFASNLSPENKGQKVLLVAPLSGHHATLMRDTVRALVGYHEVYITDWIDARQVPVTEGEFHFDDYVDYIMEFLRFIGPDTHLMAICQPTVEALIATAVMSMQDDPAVPATLTVAGGPIDVSVGKTDVNKYAEKHKLSWFEKFAIMTVPEGYPGKGRKVYPGFMQLTGFVAMNPKSHAKKYISYFFDVALNKADKVDKFEEFYDEYNAVLDLPAEFYIETIDRIFKQNLVGNMKATYRNKPVDFSAITKTALLTIEGQNDDICGPGQTEAAQRICSSLSPEMREHYIQEGVGHYGIFSGSKFRNFVRPRMTEFIRKHSA